MRDKIIIFLFVFLVVFTGCQSKKTSQITEQEKIDNKTGIYVSEWYRSEKYGRDIIDIMNFFNHSVSLNVTTVCFDENDELMPTNDTEIIEVPPKKQWTWIPLCPENTSSYTITVLEINQTSLS